MRKTTKKIITVALLVGAAVFLSTFIPISRDAIMEKLGFPYEIYDRHGTLLRKGISSKGYYFSYIKLEQIPKNAIKALIEIEDRDFIFHNGVNPRSLGAALIRNITGKKRSGGSTITMQIARNIYSLPRNIFSKMYEIWLAMRLENSFSKNELLEIYFNTIPFGNQIIGIKMAARIYFDKTPKQLSTAQVAFLIALVKFPSYIGHDKLKARIIERQRFVLKKMIEQKIITKLNYQHALSEKIHVRKMNYATIAPHYCNFLLSHLKKIYKGDLKKIGKIYTTLDFSIQQKTFQYAAESVRKLRKKRISNAAAIVLNNETGELLAMVGSVDFHNKTDSGQINGAVAIRPPGSTLKPFTYGTAISKGVLTAATIIPDIRTYIRSRTGDFVPVNYNRVYNGPITARKALACSYNVSAARVISKVTVEEVLKNLQRCNFTTLNADAAYYGASLTLGGADVTLYELAGGYLMLANQGLYRNIRVIKEIIDTSGKKIQLPKKESARRIFSRETTFLIANILSDNNARTDSFTALSPLNFPFFCAAKTGTSVGFRNNWTIGFSKNITAAVWVGNFDNTPMQGVSGITGAATIFRNIMLGTEQDYRYRPQKPKSIHARLICTKSGLLAKKECQTTTMEYFTQDTLPYSKCNVHYSIPYHAQSGKIVFVRKKSNKQPHIEWRKTTILPDIYNQWLKENGYPVPAPSTKKYIAWLEGKISVDTEKAQILYPDNGDIFIVDPILPRNAQAIIFQGSFPPDTIKVEWHLNKKRFSIHKYPFACRWQIIPGKYNLRATIFTEKKKKITTKTVSFVVN